MRHSSTRSRSVIWLLMLLFLAAAGCLKQPRVAALLRVTQDNFPGSVDEYLIYKETNASLLKSDFVVTSALRGLPKELGNKLSPQLVTDLLNIHLDETELISVSMDVKSPLTIDESIQVLDAVVVSFQSEVVNRERMREVDKLRRLRTRYARAYEKIKQSTDKVNRLAKALGVEDSADVLASQQQTIAIFQGKLLELQLQQLEANELRRVGQKQVAKQTSGVLQPSSSRDKVLASQIKFVEKGLAEATEKLLNSGQVSGELDVQKSDLISQRSDITKIRAEINDLERQLEKASRFVVLQRAVLVE